MTRNLVIRLHGVGSNGVNLVSLANVWRHALPDTEFAAPDAPFLFGHGSGRRWFERG
jgi:phospholipase/carboxylesterase